METADQIKSWLCVFCLKTADDCKNIGGSDRRRFFSNLLNFRALINADNQEWRRNACKVISEIANDGDNSESVFENAKICGSCGEIARKFTDLHHQMKDLDGRIEEEIGKLRDVMVDADKVAFKFEGELEKISTCGGVTLREFRNTLEQSCDAYQEIKKKGAVPKLGEESPGNGRKVHVDLQTNFDMLSPISLDDFTILCPEVQVFPYPSQAEVQGYPTLMEAQEYSTLVEVDSQQETLGEEMTPEHDHEGHQEQNMKVEITVIPFVDVNCKTDISLLPLSSSSPPPPLILEEEDPLNPSHNSHSTYICSTPTCSLPFTSKLYLFQHNMANHIAKYFSSVQLNKVSNEQFTGLINSLLEGILDTFEVLDEKYKCPICSDQLAGRGKARNHLVVKHRPPLKGKLEESQKSASYPHQTQSSSNSTDETSNITLKRKRDWTPEKRRRSKRLSLKEKVVELELSKIDHAQTPQIKESNSSAATDDPAKTAQKRKGGLPKGMLKSKWLKSRDLNCVKCSRSFRTRSNLFSHDMYTHPEKYFDSEKLESLSLHQFQNCIAHLLNTTVEQFQKVDSKFQCSFCNVLLSRTQVSNAKVHLIVKHRLVLREKLIELQNSSNVGLVMNTRRMTCNLSARKNEICNICKKYFKTGIILKRHKMVLHPEIFLDSCNLLPPSSSENDEKFKTSVKYILEEQLKAYNSKKGGDQVICGICSIVSGNRENAKIHLISMHRGFLGEKLEKLQQSGKSLHQIHNELVKMKWERNLERKLVQGNGSDYHTILIMQLKDSKPVCKKCGKIFKNADILIRHQTLFHPEIFFEGENPLALQHDNEGDQIFSKLVRFMVEGQVVPKFSKVAVSTLAEGENETNNKCNFCESSKVFYTRKAAITHVILKHQSNMAEILAGFNGKSVEEIKLEMVAGKGVERQL